MKHVWRLLFTLGVLLSGCGPTPTSGNLVKELRVMTHDSFAVSASIIQQFEKENGITVSFIKSGDTGAMLNRAILTSSSPEADVLYGLDNTYLSRALEANLFVPYRSTMTARIPEGYIIEPDNLVTPIDFGDVCINYDRSYLQLHNIEVPLKLDAFTEPSYREMLVVENPATSSPGLAFLLTTIANYGEADYLDYWQRLKDNDVVVVNDWSTAYYTNFSGSSGQGLQPFVVSYNTSPAAEVYFRSQFDWRTLNRRYHFAPDLLPPDRIRRYPKRHPAAGTGWKVHRLHAQYHVPGGHASSNVRLPGESGCGPSGCFHKSDRPA